MASWTGLQASPAAGRQRSASPAQSSTGVIQRSLTPQRSVSPMGTTSPSSVRFRPTTTRVTASPGNHTSDRFRLVQPATRVTASPGNVSWGHGVDRLKAALAPLQDPSDISMVPALTAWSPKSLGATSPGRPMSPRVSGYALAPGAAPPLAIVAGRLPSTTSVDNCLEAAGKRLRMVEGRVRHWHNLLFHLYSALPLAGSVRKVPTVAPPSILPNELAAGGASMDASLRSLESLSLAWEFEDLIELRNRTFACLSAAKDGQGASPLGNTFSSSQRSMSPPRRARVLGGGVSPLAQRSDTDSQSPLGLTMPAGAAGSSAQTASSKPRAPRWLEQQAKSADDLQAASDVLQLMLDRDDPDTGAKSDLEFVRGALQKAMAERGDAVFPRAGRAGRKRTLEEKTLNIDNIAEAEVDEETFEFLKTFGTGFRRKFKTLRQVFRAVMFAQKFSRVLMADIPQRLVSVSDGLGGAKHSALADLDSFSDFDIFKIQSMCGKETLSQIGMATMERHSLLQKFCISPTKLAAFLSSVEKQYLPNPYHNSLHAADCVQTIHAFTQLVPDDSLSDIEVLTALFAGACHDLGHPGVTNQFRVAMQDEGAITYNDISVSENMHCCLAYRTLQNEDNDFLDTLSGAQRIAVRKLAIDMILATDMANHFTKLAKFKAIVEEKGSEIDRWDSKSPALELLVHAADISGTTKQHGVALQWADLILAEFFAQGDRERAMGRQISPLCDRDSVSMPSSQCGFVDFIVAPTYGLLGKIVDVQKCQENLTAYRAYFGELKEQDAAKEAKEQEAAEATGAEPRRGRRGSLVKRGCSK